MRNYGRFGWVCLFFLTGCSYTRRGVYVASVKGFGGGGAPGAFQSIVTYDHSSGDTLSIKDVSAFWVGCWAGNEKDGKNVPLQEFRFRQRQAIAFNFYDYDAILDPNRAIIKSRNFGKSLELCDLDSIPFLVKDTTEGRILNKILVKAIEKVRDPAGNNRQIPENTPLTSDEIIGGMRNARLDDFKHPLGTFRNSTHSPGGEKYTCIITVYQVRKRFYTTKGSGGMSIRIHLYFLDNSDGIIKKDKAAQVGTPIPIDPLARLADERKLEKSEELKFYTRVMGRLFLNEFRETMKK